jgi:mono/diheme cytochrome c family protein
MKGSRSGVLGALGFALLVGWAVTVYAREDHPSDTFKQYCAKCHGESGKGDTERGKKLKARDFTDAEWQQSKTDADLIDSVTEGKEDMPPFGKKLTKEQIEGLVKGDVRGFAARK